MYTLQMAKAVRTLEPPKGFHVDIFDHEDFLTVRADEYEFVKLDHDSKIAAVEYMIKVKKALEDCGAIVMLERNPVS